MSCHIIMISKGTKESWTNSDRSSSFSAKILRDPFFMSILLWPNIKIYGIYWVGLCWVWLLTLFVCNNFSVFFPVHISHGVVFSLNLTHKATHPVGTLWSTEPLRTYTWYNSSIHWHLHESSTVGGTLLVADDEHITYKMSSLVVS